LLGTNRLAREKIVRIVERKRFCELNGRILPSLPDWWKADARRESRRDYHYPFVVEPPKEADAAFCKRSARVKRYIFAALKKLRVLPTKSYNVLYQKQFDPAIRPRLHQFSRCHGR